jgi:hypothetical protein
MVSARWVMQQCVYWRMGGIALQQFVATLWNIRHLPVTQTRGHTLDG